MAKIIEREMGPMKDYYKIKALADYFGLEVSTVQKKVRTMRAHPERYTRDDVFTSGKFTFVKSAAFVDWLKYGDDIEAGFNDIPEYDGSYEGAAKKIG